MSKVHLLESDVIAKIAAGEAVDRPASVVKELLENAVDSGATSIEIHLKDAGKELIHIKDNGSGIVRADLEKIFQRHATSKIKAIDDLETLRSMGFRGEALYSIAAVSDVTLASRTENDEGWQVHIKGGLRQDLSPVALAQQGTDIKVAGLFFNTPARRKFLKNNTSELNQILNIIIPYTLIYPEKRFILSHAGRTILDLRPAAAQLDRIASVLNVPCRHLIEADQEFVEEKIRIRLILGNINIQRPRRDLQYIFVNQRPVESRNLGFNLNDVYKLVLPPGAYGLFIVDLKLDPSNVDVNIHPTKREVRLKDEGRIISLLRRMAEYQLMQKGGAKEITGVSGTLTSGLTTDQIVLGPGQFQSNMSFPRKRESSFSVSGPPIKTFGGDSFPFAGDDNVLNDFKLFGHDNTLRSKFEHARYVDAFLQKFLLFEAGQSLLIVDQHAAQERIMFERFKDQMDRAQVETQPLLTPLLLKLTPQEKVAWEEMKDTLTQAGIETTQFDDQTIAIQTTPLLLKNIDGVVRTILASGKAERMDHAALARRACKASIVAGDKLDHAQVAHQRRELLACKDPFTCPHGRPTLIELTEDFLDREFLRS